VEIPGSTKIYDIMLKTVGFKNGDGLPNPNTAHAMPESIFSASSL
jgi:hypothetical protein